MHMIDSISHNRGSEYFSKARVAYEPDVGRMTYVWLELQDDAFAGGLD